jgi:hypothetical protein
VEGDGTIHYLDENGNVIASHTPPPKSNEIPKDEGHQEYKIDPFAQSLRTAPLFGSIAMALKAAGEKPNYQH